MPSITPSSASTDSLLPPDILHDIFLLAAAYHPRTFPKAASQVCRRWRDCAIDSQRLWAKIFFDRPANYQQEELWIERSGNAPLDVVIAGGAFGGGREASDRSINHILAIITPHSSRWKSLKVSKLPDEPFRTLSATLRTLAAPKLETLVVVQESLPFGHHSQGGDLDDDLVIGSQVSRFQPFQGGTPSLKELTLKRVHWDWRSPIFYGLRTLSLDNGREVGPTEVYDILRRNPQLEEFVAWSSADWPLPQIQPPELPSPKLQHNNLTKLIIESVRTVDTILQSVRTPKVTIFAARYHLRPYMFPVICEFNHLRSLRDLHIEGNPAPMPRDAESDEVDAVSVRQRSLLPHVLSLMPALVDLSFTDFDFQGDLLSCLGARCPLLKRLSLAHCEGFTADNVRRVVADRIASSEMTALKLLWVMDCERVEMYSDCQQWISENVPRTKW